MARLGEAPLGPRLNVVRKRHQTSAFSASSADEARVIPNPSSRISPSMLREAIADLPTRQFSKKNRTHTIPRTISPRAVGMPNRPLTRSRARERSASNRQQESGTVEKILPTSGQHDRSKELAYFIYALKYGYTTYNGIALSTLYVLPHIVDHPSLIAIVAHARAVLACSTLGIACVFNAAWFIDCTAFPRIAVRLGITLPAFHVANFIVHVLPCALVVLWTVATQVTIAHGGLAAMLHLGWGVWWSKTTLVLDDIYVPLPRRTWYVLWVIAVAAESLAVPLMWSWLGGHHVSSYDANV